MIRSSVLVAAFTVALLGLTGSTCQKPTPRSPIVGGVVHCAEAGVHEVAIHIIDDAASALATGDYVSALEDLVKRFGEGALDCAVAEIADTAEKHAALDELEAAKAKRAKAWLASRPVTVSGLCPNQCAPTTAALSLSGEIQFHWALPFETHAILFRVSGAPAPCDRGMHDFVLPPYALGTACVTDDYTFDVSELRFASAWAPRPPVLEI